MNLCMVHNLPNVKTFVFETLHCNITHSAIITPKTTEKKRKCLGERASESNMGGNRIDSNWRCFK